tara:strand:- start:2331 stop:2528 length:198 start_codon:yes stop_codon:yes gene_type:complete
MSFRWVQERVTLRTREKAGRGEARGEVRRGWFGNEKKTKTETTLGKARRRERDANGGVWVTNGRK